MIYSIENDFAKASINSFGAELNKYYNKDTGVSYLWSGDSKHWGKFAPVLFPVIGKVYKDKIKVNGVDYLITKHGFARDMEFTLKSKKEDSIELLISSNAHTRSMYPFDFEFIVKYELKEAKLITSFITKNTGDENMYFSVGGHPAFACPVNSVGDYSDFYLSFSQEEDADNVLLVPSTGFRSGEVQKSYLKGNKIPLTKTLFLNDALVFFGLKSQQITIRSDKYPHRLEFSFDGFPQFGIWAPVGAPFVCLEPWQGVCDEEGYEGEFKDRLGVLELAPNHIHLCTYSIEGK